MAVAKRKIQSSSRKVKKTSPKTYKKTSDLKAKVRKTLSTPNRAYTKTELYGAISSSTGLQKKEISSVFERLGDFIGAHLKKQGPGQFTVPGLMKITVIDKPATKARKGINPFTGEETMFKAKPARRVVKVRPLKGLRAMV
jgi:nucleoid DNA-binding protein